MDKEIFGKEALEQLSGSERNLRLRLLQGLLVQRLSLHASEKEFFSDMRQIVESLKEMGHDLWSRSYDGETEVWGGDYTKPKTSGKLIISFNFDKKAFVEWEPDLKE